MLFSDRKRWTVWKDVSISLRGGSCDKTIKIWDTLINKEIITLTSHIMNVSTLCFSPDGTILASGSYDKTIKLWNTVTYKELTTLSDNTDIIKSICFSPDQGPDGNTLASPLRSIY